ncbi:MAG TPA: hypothetical protein VFA17_09460 [Thermoplasmata archaeon]|nr:hypothetical protein [Thermoplasmata archaeon]
MSLARAPVPGVRSPQGWLGVAFGGIWLYLVSQLLRIFPGGVANAFDLTPPEALQALAITSGLGQVVLFTGLTSALWRANRAAGLSPFSVRGLALGAAGVLVFSLVEIALFLQWIGRSVAVLDALQGTSALDAGAIAGTALVFAGLASLGIGLSRSIDLFGRAQREAARAQREAARAAAPQPEETA